MSEEIHSVSPKDYIDANREIDRLGKRIAELKQEQAQDTIRISEQTNRAVTAEWKLAAAEAALQEAVDHCEGWRKFQDDQLSVPTFPKCLENKLRAAIDAAKTEVKE